MSTVKANDLMKVDGGIPTVKGQQLIPTAWVNFNGTSTVAIRDSENVSSITDNGTGNTTVTFTTAMANTNYAVAVSNENYRSSGFRLPTLANVEIRNRAITDNSLIDTEHTGCVILGGQA